MIRYRSRWTNRSKAHRSSIWRRRPNNSRGAAEQSKSHTEHLEAEPESRSQGELRREQSKSHIEHLDGGGRDNSRGTAAEQSKSHISVA